MELGKQLTNLASETDDATGSCYAYTQAITIADRKSHLSLVISEAGGGRLSQNVNPRDMRDTK